MVILNIVEGRQNLTNAKTGKSARPDMYKIMPNVQAQAVFKGRVQGVGFRFTVERIAIKMGVKGWVKNLDNGDVEVVAEAEEKILDDFLNLIKTQFQRYIRDEEVTFSEAAGRFRDFVIRF